MAIKDKVYVTLGLDAPVSQLDARTGDILKTYANTKFTEEILADNFAFLILNQRNLPSPEIVKKLERIIKKNNVTVQSTTTDS